jgi:hypothetical protein
MYVCGAFVTSPMRVCQRGFPGEYVVRHQIAIAIAGEQQLPGRGQQSAPAAIAVVRTFHATLPVV